MKQKIMADDSAVSATAMAVDEPAAALPPADADAPANAPVDTPVDVPADAAEGPAVPVLPLPVLPPAPPVGVGDKMEVTSLEEGVIGSWYEVEILELDEGGADGGARAHVKYTIDSSQEWVATNLLRPLPPAAPTGPSPTAWTRRLSSGDMVELSFDSGWWETQYQGRSGATLRVLAVRYGKVHEVKATLLRPGWKRGLQPGDEWTLTLGGMSRTVAEVEAMLHKPSRAAAHSVQAPPGGAASAAGCVDPAAAAAEPYTDGYKWGVAVEVQAELVSLTTSAGTLSVNDRR